MARAGQVHISCDIAPLVQRNRKAHLTLVRKVQRIVYDEHIRKLLSTSHGVYSEAGKCLLATMFSIRTIVCTCMESNRTGVRCIRHAMILTLLGRFSSNVVIATLCPQMGTYDTVQHM